MLDVYTVLPFSSIWEEIGSSLSSIAHIVFPITLLPIRSPDILSNPSTTDVTTCHTAHLSLYAVPVRTSEGVE